MNYREASLKRERAELVSALDLLSDSSSAYQVVGSIMVSRSSSELRDELSARLKEVNEALVMLAESSHGSE